MDDDVFAKNPTPDLPLGINEEISINSRAKFSSIPTNSKTKSKSASASPRISKKSGEKRLKNLEVKNNTIDRKPNIARNAFRSLRDDQKKSKDSTNPRRVKSLRIRDSKNSEKKPLPEIKIPDPKMDLIARLLKSKTQDGPNENSSPIVQKTVNPSKTSNKLKKLDEIQNNQSGKNLKTERKIEDKKKVKVLNDNSADKKLKKSSHRSKKDKKQDSKKSKKKHRPSNDKSKEIKVAQKQAQAPGENL